MPSQTFPENFLFGAATSAHQVEGNNTNSDWWAWEGSSQRRVELERLGKTPANFFSGRACDHYKLFEKDLDLIKNLGHNAYRFSLEWARIEPEPGAFNGEAIKHYQNVLIALHQRNITPVVTLHHFTNPAWFAKKGGWANAQAPSDFQRYVEHVAQKFHEHVPYWLTINEPSAFVAEGYLAQRWPPQKRDPLLAYQAIQNTVRAHQAVYHVLKKYSEAPVGITYNFRAWKPHSTRPWDKFAARLADHLTWQWFLDRTNKTLDFIGVNYYFSNRIGFRFGNPIQRGCSSTIKSDMDWDSCPQGMEDILTALWERYHKPLMVTENGLADANDSRRSSFLLEHLQAVHRSMGKGVHVLGYLHWSLMDNFEWAEGFTPRFGLIEIDYQTMERKPRQSAYLYANICKTRILPKA